MKKLNVSIIALAVSLSFSMGANAEAMTKDQYKSHATNINAEYKIAKTKCDAFSGNARDICSAEAKGNKSVAKANLEDSYHPTVETHYDARVAKAEASYSVSMEKCDDKAGNDEDVCVKEAKAAKSHELADAKAQMKTSKVDTTAYEKEVIINKDATADKRDADYAVAKEKCDVLAGGAKDVCISEAKVRFGD